jgi:hypothetical protein
MSTSTDTNKEIHEEKQEKCKTKDLIYIDPQQSVVHETVTLRDQSRNKINIDSDEKRDHHNDDEEKLRMEMIKKIGAVLYQRVWNLNLVHKLMEWQAKMKKIV